MVYNDTNRQRIIVYVWSNWESDWIHKKSKTRLYSITMYRPSMRNIKWTVTLPKRKCVEAQVVCLTYSSCYQSMEKKTEFVCVNLKQDIDIID